MTSHFTFTSLISSIVKWGYTIYSTGLLWGSNNMCKGLSTRLDTSLPFNNYYSLNANLHGYNQTHRKHTVLWEQIKLGGQDQKAPNTNLSLLIGSIQTCRQWCPQIIPIENYICIYYYLFNHTNAPCESQWFHTREIWEAAPQVMIPKAWKLGCQRWAPWYYE